MEVRLLALAAVHHDSPYTTGFQQRLVHREVAEVTHEFGAFLVAHLGVLVVFFWLGHGLRGIFRILGEGVWRQGVVRHDPARYRAEARDRPDTMT